MVCATIGSAPLDAQETSATDAPPWEGARYSNPVKSRWRVGVTIRGGSRPIGNVLMTLPVPNDWPEQRVSLVEEQVPDNIGKVGFRELEMGVRQMVVQMPVLPPNQEVTVAVVVEVETSQQDPPDSTASLVLPRSNDRDARTHLGISPHVNHRNGKFRRVVRELIESESEPWNQAELLCHWVQDNIETRDGETTDALTTFETRSGDNESRVFLFVAMCRSVKIPARIVFGRNMVYAEFMLAGADQEQTYWFPCNVNGDEFGSLSDPRIILQKGDNISVPEKEQRQKYVAEFLSCKGQSRPIVKFFREPVVDAP